MKIGQKREENEKTLLFARFFFFQTIEKSKNKCYNKATAKIGGGQK